MLRAYINQYLKANIKDEKSVAILFSGGLDSLSLMLSCLDLGVKPTLYTFYLEHYPSEDLYNSRNIANLFNLDLNEVSINDTNINQLQKDVQFIIKEYNVKKKTAIQCIYPFLYVAPIIKEKVVLSGLCADDLYGTPLSMAKHRDTHDLFNKLRLDKINNPSASSYLQIKTLFEKYNKTFIAPYKESFDIIAYFQQFSYREMNSPKQKYLTYKAYQEEIENYGLYRRNSNLQINSNIREWHDNLLHTSWNTGSFKTIVSLYNHVYRQLN